MSSTYERLEWIRDYENEPHFINSELDDERYEARKIELFAAGRIVEVSEDRPERGSTGLVVLPVPGIEEVNAIREEEFLTEEIGAAAFDDLWKPTINAAGLIRLSAWQDDSTNFVLTEFSEAL